MRSGTGKLKATVPSKPYSKQLENNKRAVVNVNKRIILYQTTTGEKIIPSEVWTS